MSRTKTITLACVLTVLCATATARAQETRDEALDVETRVVFVDALVRDKRTGASVGDLKREEFEVLDEGRPRALDYFSRESDRERKPLALALVLDVGRYGADRFLKRPEVLEAMMKELARLPAGDEVAVCVTGAAFVGGGWLTPFTSDRKQTAAALARVASIIEQNARCWKEVDDGRPAPASCGGETGLATNAIGAAVAASADEEVESRTETFENNQFITRTVYKNGDTITWTQYMNGRVRTIKRSKDGAETEIFDYATPLKRATMEAVRLAADERPMSRAAIVWVSDGVVPVYKVEQRDAERLLLRRGVIFNALVTDMLFGFKLFKPVLKPIGDAVGVSIYNSASRLASETGGVALRVRRPDDYARGLSKIVGDLTARYSLGFKLAADEAADGRLRRLEVRVNARDAKGRRRKLEVAARRGYFAPVENRMPPADGDRRRATALP